VGNHAFLPSGSPTSPFVVFAPGANGNVAPLRAIGGPRTGLSGAGGVALDPVGELYASNTFDFSASGSSITVYAPGASGNVAPLRTIQGPTTRLNSPVHIFLR
jgi:hypothetical protein